MKSVKIYPKRIQIINKSLKILYIAFIYKYYWSFGFEGKNEKRTKD